MSELTITLAEGRTAYAPSQRLQGCIEWQLSRPPVCLELTLLWQTRGKGTQDVGVVEAMRFDDPGAFGRREFEMQLPDGPFSFSGKLISIVWMLELSLPKGKKAVQQEIILSPTGQEIICTEQAGDPTAGRPSGSMSGFIKKFRFSGRRF